MRFSATVWASIASTNGRMGSSSGLPTRPALPRATARAASPTNPANFWPRRSASVAMMRTAVGVKRIVLS